MASNDHGHHTDIAHSGSASGPYSGTTIHDGKGGYRIQADAGEHPVVTYDRNKYRLERDPSSTEQIEKFKIVPKEQKQ